MTWWMVRSTWNWSRSLRRHNSGKATKQSIRFMIYTHQMNVGRGPHACFIKQWECLSQDNSGEFPQGCKFSSSPHQEKLPTCSSSCISGLNFGKDERWCSWSRVGKREERLWSESKSLLYCEELRLPEQSLYFAPALFAVDSWCCYHRSRPQAGLRSGSGIQFLLTWTSLFI